MACHAEAPVTISSESTARRHAGVVEESRDRRSLPPEADPRARIEAILDGVNAGRVPTMTEFDAREYDEQGNPR